MDYNNLGSSVTSHIQAWRGMVRRQLEWSKWFWRMNGGDSKLVIICSPESLSKAALSIAFFAWRIWPISGLDANCLHMMTKSSETAKPSLSYLLSMLFRICSSLTKMLSTKLREIAVIHRHFMIVLWWWVHIQSQGLLSSYNGRRMRFESSAVHGLVISLRSNL